jgi:hypothetical protein
MRTNPNRLESDSFGFARIRSESGSIARADPACFRELTVLNLGNPDESESAPESASLGFVRIRFSIARWPDLTICLFEQTRWDMIDQSTASQGKRLEPWRRLAKRQGVSTRTLDRRVAAGVLPPPIRIKGRKYGDPDVMPRCDGEERKEEPP